MVPVDVAKADRPPKRHRPPENILHGSLLTPRGKKLIRRHLHREWQVIAAEHPRITDIGVTNKGLVIRKKNWRAAYVVAPIPRIFKFPLIAGDQFILDLVFSLIVGQHIGGKPAEGADLQHRGSAGQPAHRIVHQVEVPAVQHPGIRKA